MTLLRRAGTDLGLFLAKTPPFRRLVNFAATDPEPPSGEIAAAMQVEYVNASGVRHTTDVVSGVTSISGVAPFSVKFNACGTRLTTAFAAQVTYTDEEAFACLFGGHRINYGEGSGNWTYPVGSSFPKNEDRGGPMNAHTYRTPGTYTVRDKVRDPLGNETTISLTVVVSAPVTTVHIPVSAGSWPTFVSGRRYTLDADGSYTGFGQADTGGLHNILFEKIGTGANPILASFTPDGRSKFDAVEEMEYRAAAIRLVNIQINHFNEGQRGFDHVTLIGCTVNRFTNGGQSNLWHEVSPLLRSNVRHSRGFFVIDSEMRSSSVESGYIIIGTFNGFHGRGTRFVHAQNGDTTYAMVRMYGCHNTFRNCLWTCEVNGGSGNGTVISHLAMDGVDEVAWPEDDLVGPIDSGDNGDRLGYISDMCYAQNNQFYEADSFFTNAITSVGGGNPEGATRVRPRLMGWEDNVFFPEGDVTFGGTDGDGELYGQHMYWRNNRRGMGAGDYVDANIGAPNNSVGDTVTYNGPFLREDANTRPVASAFA